MTQSEKWLREITFILEMTGGRASLSGIYKKIEERGVMDISSPFWKSRVRDTIEKYSSDSQIFAHIEDVFYSVAGIGKGMWGLRSFIAPTPKAEDLPNAEEGTERAKQEVYRILRDTALARALKSSYDHVCQLCGTTIILSNGTRYAEAHHIRPLGNPHDGPDVKGNILCLCPTCHVKMDYGVVQLDTKLLNIHPKHGLRADCVAWHNEKIAGNKK